MFLGSELFGGEKITFKKSFDYKADDLTMTPKLAEHIQINGEDCDLRNPKVVKEFELKILKYQDLLKAHKLQEYDGKSTEVWKGGRSELLKDSIRIKFAKSFHEGKHTLSWADQKLEADRIASIRSAQLKAEGIK